MIQGEIPSSFVDAVEKLDEIMPAAAQDAISSELYSTFWCLGLYDLQVPTDQYETELKKLKSEEAKIDLKSGSESTRRKVDCMWCQGCWGRLHGVSGVLG